MNLDDKKFKDFKKLKKKQHRMGKKLKPILKLTTSGVGREKGKITEGSMDKSKIKEFASLMPAIASTEQTDLNELLKQMNKHSIVQLNLTSK